MKTLWVVGIVFFLVGVGMLTGGFFLWRSNASFAAHAVHADGVVTDLDYQSSSKGKGTYHPLVDFTAANGTVVHYTSSSGSNPAAYSRGDHVAMLYDPANPEHAQIDSFMENWFGTLMLGAFGLVSTLIGGGIIWSRLNQRKVRAWLAQNGMRSQAKFENVLYDTSLQINGRSPWRLVCQWQHPVTQKVYMFRSDPIWYDPTSFVDKREVLDVLVNMDNPKQYQVDTAFLPKAG